MKAKAAPKRPPRVPVAARPAPHTARNLDLWYLAAIVAIGVAIYWRTLWGPFLFDDADLLEVRSSMRLKDWRIIFGGPRALLMWTFVFNHWLTGSDPFYFHVVSVALHSLNTLLVWKIVRRICGPGFVSAAVPLLFLTSPVQTESVGYISSRSELLAATFYLLALVVFVSSWREKRPWITAFLVAAFYAGSVSSKQHGLTLPGAILLLDYFFLAGRQWRGMLRNWPTYAVLGAGMAAGGFIVVRAVINVPSAGFYLAEVTWKDYLFTQFRMYFLYLRLLAAPVGLNADYDIIPSRTLWEHASWLALAGLVALAGSAVWLRRRAVLYSFGVLFFLMTLFPTSSFYPLLDYAAERRLYLPSLGFFLAVAGLAASAVSRPRLLWCGLAAVMAFHAATTHHRNRVWQDGLALWEDAAAKSPRKWRAQNNLGFEYSQRRRFADAERAYRRAAELIPQKNTRNHAEILSSLGSTYANRRMYAEAVVNYQAALKITPEIPTLWTNLAIAELRLGRPEGWTRFQKALDLNDVAWEPWFARGNLYYEFKRYDEAIRDYERVLYLNPDHADARYNLAAARAMKKRLESGR